MESWNKTVIPYLSKHAGYDPGFGANTPLFQVISILTYRRTTSLPIVFILKIRTLSIIFF